MKLASSSNSRRCGPCSPASTARVNSPSRAASLRGESRDIGVDEPRRVEPAGDAARQALPAGELRIEIDVDAAEEHVPVALVRLIDADRACMVGSRVTWQPACWSARAHVLSCMHDPQNMPAPPAVDEWRCASVDGLGSTGGCPSCGKRRVPTRRVTKRRLVDPGTTQWFGIFRCLPPRQCGARASNREAPGRPNQRRSARTAPTQLCACGSLLQYVGCPVSISAAPPANRGTLAVDRPKLVDLVRLASSAVSLSVALEASGASVPLVALVASISSVALVD